MLRPSLFLIFVVVSSISCFANDFYGLPGYQVSYVPSTAQFSSIGASDLQREQELIEHYLQFTAFVAGSAAVVSSLLVRGSKKN